MSVRMETLASLDVTTATFDKEVLEASHAMPVVVDFWAPWCGPCRALGPILEKLAAEHGGRMRLAKVNSDENQDLARQFNVRSIPDVRAFRGGRAVAQFTGALPERQVRAFIESLLPSASQEALERAEAAFKAGKVDEAEGELAAVKYDPDWETRVEALKQGIAFARSGSNERELAARVAASPADLEGRLALAGACARRKAWREAMDQLLEILRRDKGWRDGEARRQMLAIFSLAADAPDLVSEYRRKLAATLY